jgi:DNA-binding MarR family transcriptional regulator
VVDDSEPRLETATLHLVNMTAYGSSSRAHSRRLRDVTGIDLPPSDIRLLEFLSGRDPLPLSALAAELGIDLAQASRQATALEALGHVVRVTDPADRRRTLVSLSRSTERLMDRWLLDWSTGYVAAVDGWSGEDVGHLTRWFALVHRRFDEGLPGRDTSHILERWQELVPPGDYDPAVRQFLRTLVGLLSWVGQSGGFNDLLELVKAPIRQHAFFTLRVVARHGPMAIAEVADQMAIDPSQASKRLRQLTDLGLVDRAVDTFDRRSNRVRVSRKGAALDRKVRETQLETFQLILGELPPVDRERWTELVEQFLTQLGETVAESNRWGGLATVGDAVSR